MTNAAQPRASSQMDYPPELMIIRRKGSRAVEPDEMRGTSSSVGSFQVEIIGNLSRLFGRRELKLENKSDELDLPRPRIPPKSRRVFSIPPDELDNESSRAKCCYRHDELPFQPSLFFLLSPEEFINLLKNFSCPRKSQFRLPSLVIFSGSSYFPCFLVSATSFGDYWFFILY